MIRLTYKEAYEKLLMDIIRLYIANIEYYGSLNCQQTKPYLKTENGGVHTNRWGEDKTADTPIKEQIKKEVDEDYAKTNENEVEEKNA